MLFPCVRFDPGWRHTSRHPTSTSHRVGSKWSREGVCPENKYQSETSISIFYSKCRKVLAILIKISLNTDLEGARHLSGAFDHPRPIRAGNFGGFRINVELDLLFGWDLLILTASTCHLTTRSDLSGQARISPTVIPTHTVDGQLGENGSIWNVRKQSQKKYTDT